MFMAHRTSLTGEPVPEEAIEQRKKRLTGGQRAIKNPVGLPPLKSWHSPAARENAAKTRLANFRTKSENKVDEVAAPPSEKDLVKQSGHYAKLAAKGIYRCPECMQVSHKKVEFPTARELGKHRRFKHGVVGAKTLKKNSPTANVVADKDGEFKCPQCPKTFATRQGLSIHGGQHSKTGQPKEPAKPTSKELVHVNGSTQGTVVNLDSQRTERRGDHHDASYVEAIAVANLTGHLQSLILNAAHEYDLPPRQLAKRCLLALSELYT
jgi:uncharacterized C2H2 Zn-finger protein